jgi:hypothetical protein
MLAWETGDFADQPAFIRDFAEIWRGGQDRLFQDAGGCIERQDRESSGTSIPTGS